MALLPNPPREQALEGAFLELAILLQKIETNEAYNPDKKNQVNIIIDSDTKLASITARLPVDFYINQRGEQVYKARQYTLVDQVIPPEEFTIPT